MASEQEQLKAALNLMRRMPPNQTETNLNGLINLVPDLTDELLQRVDQPLKVAKDPKSGRSYVLCDYNRDGDSYRSPWSNQYFPAIEDDDGFMPSHKLRKLEEEANYLFDKYRHLYFEGGHSSVYMWDLDEGNFAACFLIRKDVGEVRGLQGGAWNSIHVFEVQDKGNDQFLYKLTTTVIVEMAVDNDTVGEVDLSGSMTKQQSKTARLDASTGTGHLQHMGKLVEEMELTIRNAIEGIYIQKTREVINGMRSQANAQKSMLANLMPSLSDAIGKHGRKMNATM